MEIKEPYKKSISDETIDLLENASSQTISELFDFVTISIFQNTLQDLDDDIKQCMIEDLSKENKPEKVTANPEDGPTPKEGDQ